MVFESGERLRDRDLPGPAVRRILLRGRQRLEIQALERRARRALVRPIPLRVAAITTPGKALAVRAISRVLGAGRGAQAVAVGRQQLARIPLPAKVAGGVVGVTALTEAFTGQSPIPLARDVILRAGEGIGRSRAPEAPERRAKMPRGTRLAVGQELPPSHVVVKTWQTFPGGPVFARLADGHIAVQKKDGTIKHFRPYRPVCIPRKFDPRALRRVATALKRQRKAATAILKLTGGVPKR